jgi:predicted DNA-binding transcriptional regulator AlpA
MEESLLKEKQVAAMLGLSLPTLRAWRGKKYGPRVVKLGTKPGSPVRYRPEDVRLYIEGQVR